MDSGYVVDLSHAGGRPLSLPPLPLATARQIFVALAGNRSVTWLRLRNAATGRVIIEQWIGAHRPDAETACALLRPQAG